MVFVLDDVNGGWLKHDKVEEARKTELEWLHRQGECEKRIAAERKEGTGAPPERLPWIGTNKGDDVNESYRSRLAVREKGSKGEEGRALLLPYLFCTMPPLECMVIASLMVTLEYSKFGNHY